MDTGVEGEEGLDLRTAAEEGVPVLPRGGPALLLSDGVPGVPLLIHESDLGHPDAQFHDRLPQSGCGDSGAAFILGG